MQDSFDSVVKIAHGKKVCQDFAASGDVGVIYGALADGCSTAPNSESGAVDLVNSLEPYLFPGCDFEHAFMGACGRADALRSIRGKAKDTLYATLVCITSDGTTFRSAVGGDGFEVYRQRKTGFYDIRHTEFSQNAPSYPIYFLTPDLLDYKKACEVTNNCRIETNMVLDVNKGFMSQPWKETYGHWSLSGVLSVICSPRPIKRSVAEYDLGLIFSDGLDSFKDEADNTIPLLEVLKVFLAFKGLNGEFLQRRMNFAWEEVAKRGWHNTDDFSVAGISHV